MSYTIIGGLIGAAAASIFCALTGKDTSSHYAPSDGALIIIAGTLLGAGCGFGLGVTALASGTHITQKLFKLVW